VPSKSKKVTEKIKKISCCEKKIEGDKEMLFEIVAILKEP
jgi:hypothetical protein